MKKHFLLLLAVVLPMMASAYDAVIGGIAYDFDQNERTATVTYWSNPPSTINIPATVTLNGEEYWVTGIAAQAFKGCTGITSVTIGSNVTSIGSEAFANCSGLSSVTLLDFHIFEIWESVFSDYHYYSTTLYVPTGFKDYYEDWGWDRFQKMVETSRALAGVKIGSIYYNLIPELNMAEVTNSWGGRSGAPSVYSGSVEIPSSVTYNGIQCNVKSIGEDAFSACGRMTSVTIPGSVTSIGNSAFYFCMKLPSIEIPNSVKRIGINAFYSCSSLTYISLPNVVSIGEAAFQYCTSFTWFTIPEAVTSIKDHTFDGCTSLTYLDIHDRVTSIGSNAFRDCSSLGSVTIPSSVKRIDTQAFFGCRGLREVTSFIKEPFEINTRVFEYYDNAYYFISATLFVPYKTKAKYEATPAWNKFQNIEEFIPNPVLIDGIYYNLYPETKEAEVTNLAGGNGNGGNSYSDNIDVPSNVTYEGDEFNVTGIGKYAFFDCSKLKSVTIPGSVTKIGDCAFYLCSSMQSVTIPHSVKSIGSQAFWGCNALTYVVSLISNPFEISESIFYDYNDQFIKATLFVPKGTKAKYEAAAAWNKFQKIKEFVVKGDVNADGSIDVADIASVIDAMAGSTDVSSALADVNGDGSADVADIGNIIDIMAGSVIEFRHGPACPNANHPHWIDLGLPSGTQWACCNVGAEKPEDYGNYYTFFEAQAYNPPSLDQIKELINNTISEWTTLNGVNGRRIIGLNGCAVFLPAAGSIRRYHDWDSSNIGTDGYYWSSTCDDYEGDFAAFLWFNSNRINYSDSFIYEEERNSVRPVRKD